MSLAAAQKQILKETNAARSKAKLPALKTYTALNNVAVTWAKKQASSNTMSHNPKYASQIPTGWSAAGENVAYGYSPTSVTDAWMDSKGHRENILRTSFTHIGIGVSCSASGRAYYTQVFGGYKTLKAGTPAIAGTVKSGVTLKAKTGTWTGKTTKKYQWYLSGKAVSGATKSTFTPKAADAGKSITVKVTGTKKGYAPAAKFAKTTKVAKGTALTAPTPTVTGTTAVGKKLSVKKGTWTAKTTFTYQWLRNGKAISKATGATYTLKKADKGTVISVKVTGKKSGYLTTSRVSAKTSKIR